MIVVDTNVISELMRKSPDPLVLKWLTVQAPAEIRVTAITVAEVSYGLDRLPKGRRRTALRNAAAEVFEIFADFVLPFDEQSAWAYGELASRRDRIGEPMNVLDAQIASICSVRGALLATRNVKDFAKTGVPLINPWM